MYYLCSENKGADQLRDYREADLRLCFRICKKRFSHDEAPFIIGDQSLITWTEKQVCEVCEGKPDAVKRCIDCDQNFCQACSKVQFTLESLMEQSFRITSCKHVREMYTPLHPTFV